MLYKTWRYKSNCFQIIFSWFFAKIVKICYKPLKIHNRLQKQGTLQNKRKEHANSKKPKKEQFIPEQACM